MRLTDTFADVIDSLPGGWLDCVVDLSVGEPIGDASRALSAFVAAAGAQPSPLPGFQFRVRVNGGAGHGRTEPEVTAALRMIEAASLPGGTLQLSDVRANSVHAFASWNPPDHWRVQHGGARILELDGAYSLRQVAAA